MQLPNIVHMGQTPLPDTAKNKIKTVEKRGINKQTNKQINSVYGHNKSQVIIKQTTTKNISKLKSL